jgi:malate dehydrogenase (oxaloacetate-decarboxylating)
MGIPIGKLSLYTACGGISPAYCLPILLDVGTNNQQLLDDPMYMGWRNPRISGDEYNEFVDLFIQAVKRRWPEALLQFEDFAQENATPLLNKYRDQLCCFNDDIQGTAAVSVGTLIAACLNKGQKLSEQKIAFLGAGSAGCGIAEHIVRQMQREGLTEAQARSQVFMVDRYGLLTDSMTELQKFQVPLVQKESDIAHWDKSNKLGLAQVVQQGGVTVLFGVSGQKGLFTQEVIEALCANTEHPIVLPLSNPTTRVEATPQEVMNWSRGKAIIATGSPFPPTTFNGQTFEVSQCNNSYIFPGIGLGVLAAQATSISDNMLMAASQALADISMEYQKAPGAILPPIKVIREISEKIAYAVAVQAVEDKLALPDTAENLQRRIEANFWLPEYRHYRRTSF